MLLPPAIVFYVSPSFDWLIHLKCATAILLSSQPIVCIFKAWVYHYSILLNSTGLHSILLCFKDLIIFCGSPCCYSRILLTDGSDRTLIKTLKILSLSCHLVPSISFKCSSWTISPTIQILVPDNIQDLLAYIHCLKFTCIAKFIFLRSSYDNASYF